MRTSQMMFSTLGTRGRRFVPSDVHFGYWLMAWLYQLVGGRTGPGCSLLLRCKEDYFNEPKNSFLSLLA